MQPKIIKTNEYIEVLGHYDDPILCAKMTTLADLYAVEHRDGYAKFKIEDEDKLQTINGKLQFIGSDVIIYIDDVFIGQLTMAPGGDPTIYVITTGATFGTPEQAIALTYTYSGSETFLGFSETQGSSSAEYSVGNTYPLNWATYYFYTVTQSSSYDLLIGTDTVQNVSTVKIEDATSSSYIDFTIEQSQTTVNVLLGENRLDNISYLKIRDADSTNNDFISFYPYILTNLTGTTWYFNDTISFPVFSDEIFIDFNYFDDTHYQDTAESLLFEDDTLYYDAEDPYYYISGGWTQSEVRTIYITGGQDATNSNVINWLSANATHIT